MSKLILSFNQEKQKWSSLDENGREILAVNELDNKERWGLYDTTDNVWLGDEKGPKLYNQLLAKIAARVTEKQLGYEPGRVIGRVYDNSGNKLRDTVDTIMSGEEAVRRLEAGEL